MKPTKAELFMFKLAYPDVDIENVEFHYVNPGITKVVFPFDPEAVFIEKFTVQRLKTNGKIRFVSLAMKYVPRYQWCIIRKGSFRSYWSPINAGVELL